ncbi:GTP-binding protein [Pseudomonas sp. EMN2]|uniref:GTP-binding protein n=1 Tax=Pseudomonas sp. EMN2 TaxID=2615212 RepID=UPI00129B1075|nr:GTP-binding protein [Pseudomonas sp. EMN2]
MFKAVAYPILKSNVVTIGPAGHGKTTLTAALIRCSAENYSSSVNSSSDSSISIEDKARLAANSTSPVSYDSESCRYSHLDCAGDAEQIKNTLTKAAKIDGAILVYSVVDWTKEQTIEYLNLCKQLGVEHIVVFLNKAELQEDFEQCESIEMQIRDLLDVHGFKADDPTFALGSALKALKGEEGEFGTDAVLNLFKVMARTIPSS